MTLKETRQQYTNKVFVEAGDSTTETQVDETPTPKPDGESRIFGVRFPIATKPTIKINTVAVSDSDVGILGLDTGKEWYWQKNSKAVTQDESETVLIDTDTISVSYQGLKPIRVTSDNPVGQNDRAFVEGGTGLYERNEVQRNIDDKAAAKQLADGILVKYGTIPRNVMIRTKEYRQSGQLVNVSSSNLEILEDTLITDVTIRDISCGVLEYRIKAASSVDLGSWVEFFRTLKESTDLVIRDNEILVILLSFDEVESHNGIVDLKVFDHPVVADDVICDDTLICGGDAIEEVTIND